MSEIYIQNVVKKDKEMKNNNKHMENIMRKTNIYPISVPEGESGDNGGKAIFE